MRLRADSPSAWPMSIQSAEILDAFSRSSPSWRWRAFLPTTPVTGPPEARMRTRWPTSTSASHPPTGANQA